MWSMSEMPMPGGWTMSMVWIRMPGQTWASTSVAFLIMWVAMMGPMMLPALIPMLSRYRATMTAVSVPRLTSLTVGVSVGYFAVWTAMGAIVFPVGAGVAAIAMPYPSFSRAVPLVSAAVVVLAGVFQFTERKARHLACCAEMSRAEHAGQKTIGAAWRHGIALGLRCSACCANLMVILLVLGVMDLRVMAAVTAAITVERIGLFDRQAARATGTIVLGVGLWLAAAACGPQFGHLAPGRV
jgi:predicted metal-binding membrane protein